MFTYIRPVKFNVQILNVRNAPAKVFGLVTIKIPKTNIIIPLWTSYYTPQNPQNIISPNILKHYNQLIVVGTEALIWLQITTSTVMKLKVETAVKQIYEQLLGLINIDVLNIEQQHPSGQDIITVPMTPIINSSFNKHPISWEFIHCRLLHPSDSFMNQCAIIKP